MLPMGMYFPFQNNQVTLLHQQVHRYNFFQNNIFLEVKFFFHCGTLNAANKTCRIQNQMPKG